MLKMAFPLPGIATVNSLVLDANLTSRNKRINDIECTEKTS